MVIGPVGAIGEVPLATAYLVTANPKSDDETTSPESRYGAYTPHARTPTHETAHETACTGAYTHTHMRLISHMC